MYCDHVNRVNGLTQWLLWWSPVPGQSVCPVVRAMTACLHVLDDYYRQFVWSRWSVDQLLLWVSDFVWSGFCQSCLSTWSGISCAGSLFWIQAQSNVNYAFILSMYYGLIGHYANASLIQKACAERLYIDSYWFIPMIDWLITMP